MALKYVSATKPGEYKPIENTATYEAPEYTSRYQDQLDNALNGVVNFQYDPTKDASYQALANIYNARGLTAAKDTMGQAAALNGGYGSSYATTAAAQERSRYNQEFAALMPQFEERAYNRAQGTLNALRDAENTDYGRFRDQTSDAQWKYGMDYQNWRDLTADNQWQYGTDLQNYQWANEYNLNLWSTQQELALERARLAQARASASGGGGSSYVSGGTAGSSGSGSNASYGDYASAKIKSALSNASKSIASSFPKAKK